VTAVLAFASFWVGALFAVLVNRLRWSIFPMSGGAPLLDFMGQPDDVARMQQPLEVHSPCPECRTFHTPDQKFFGACRGPGSVVERFPCPKCGTPPEMRQREGA
jgi:hypothetical protein